MTFRVVNGLMAALFLFAVVVQYNDPDPAAWMLIYGAACAAATLAAVRGVSPFALSALAGLIALAWAGFLAAGGARSLDLYAHMFDAWEMKSVPVEEARETSGLLIVSAWMAVLAVHALRRRRSGNPVNESIL